MPRLRGLERAWMKTCECEMTGVCVNVCVSVRVSVPLSVVGPGPLVGEDYSREKGLPRGVEQDATR